MNRFVWQTNHRLSLQIHHKIGTIIKRLTQLKKMGSRKKRDIKPNSEILKERSKESRILKERRKKYIKEGLEFKKILH